MIHIILFEPQIPQNTGNIGRLCAVTKSTLHLIHPLGFKITDSQLKRSGMDYWHTLNLHEYPSWESFLQSPQRPKNIWLLSTKATKAYWDVSYQASDGFLFGNEGSGCPQEVHEWAGNKRITIPHMDQALRSLNLSTSVGIVAYEALRQILH